MPQYKGRPHSRPKHHHYYPYHHWWYNNYIWDDYYDYYDWDDDYYYYMKTRMPNHNTTPEPPMPPKSPKGYYDTDTDMYRQGFKDGFQAGIDYCMSNENNMVYSNTPTENCNPPSPPPPGMKEGE